MNHAPARLDRVQKRLAKAGGVHIGDLVSWNATRVDVPRQQAREIFATEALAELIPELDPATALSRAVAEVRKPPGILVRPFAQPTGTAMSFGVYVQRAGHGETGDAYICGARCRVDEHGLVVAAAPEGGNAVAGAAAHAEAVVVHARHLVDHCETRDLSSAMVAAVKALSGVALRDRGGFYLLPPFTCARWDRLRRLLEPIGIEPIRIEMHDAPDNINTARAAAQGALEADVSQLMADLERARTEGMRQHALTRRVELCKELAAKAELYRGVLAGIADQIATRVAGLQDEFRRHIDGDSAAFALAVND